MPEGWIHPLVVGAPGVIPSSLLAAAADPELKPRDLAVYVVLLDQLDYHSYRPLKQTWLQRHLGMTRANVSKCLTRLVGQGYVERQGYARRGTGANYRIPLSPKE